MKQFPFWSVRNFLFVIALNSYLIKFQWGRLFSFYAMWDFYANRYHTIIVTPISDMRGIPLKFLTVYALCNTLYITSLGNLR